MHFWRETSHKNFISDKKFFFNEQKAVRALKLAKERLAPLGNKTSSLSNVRVAGRRTTVSTFQVVLF